MPAWFIEAHKLLVGDEIVLPGLAAIARIKEYHYNGSGRVRLRVELLQKCNTWEAFGEPIDLSPACSVIRTHRPSSAA